MNANRGHIYQSGERVSISGMYEVVGFAGHGESARTAIVQSLHSDEVFPCFDGVEVCWHLRSRIIEVIPEATVSDASDTIFYG
ncbi:MAG: hypothetical protein IT324_02005 [Anaerolineae bacterium]|nr:hypothetical protein [Anaerolineae bacterium]